MRKKKGVYCPYCKAKATLHPLSYVYGEKANRSGYVYVCDRYPKCDAYVWAHPKTLLPMGTLANGDLRNKRIQAHRAFDRLWKSGRMKKWQAYKWMQGKLDLSPEEAHIGKFGDYMCDRLIIACNQAHFNMA